MEGHKECFVATARMVGLSTLVAQGGALWSRLGSIGLEGQAEADKSWLQHATDDDDDDDDNDDDDDDDDDDE